MRFGICVSMAATRSDGTGAEWIPLVKSLGYDYVELPLAELTALSEADFAALQKTLIQEQLPCECCNNFFPKHFRLTGPEVERAAIETYMDIALHRAAALGASLVVFGSGAAKAVPTGFPHDEAYQQLISLLQTMDAVAQEYGLTIVLEPLHKPECNIINTFADACRLAGDAGVDHVKVLVDYFHLNWEQESPQVLVDNAQWLRHVHISCPGAPLRGIRVAPFLMDGWNYRPFASALQRAGYHARISLEAYTTVFDAEAADALRFLRTTFPA